MNKIINLFLNIINYHLIKAKIIKIKAENADLCSEYNELKLSLDVSMVITE